MKTEVDYVPGARDQDRGCVRAALSRDSKDSRIFIHPIDFAVSLVFAILISCVRMSFVPNRSSLQYLSCNRFVLIFVLPPRPGRSHYRAVRFVSVSTWSMLRLIFVSILDIDAKHSTDEKHNASGS